MTRYQEVRQLLWQWSRRWLITGVAGLIGYNLLEALLKLGQQVVGLANFSTGYAGNLEQVREAVGIQGRGSVVSRMNASWF
jgi:UDP-N-acetylglucosamine/UDP-N-acetyl-alpha-D-glucosaminouronate 4-epimerase